MKLPLQIFSWIAIVLGAITLVASIVEYDGYAIIGGAFFLIQGILAIAYIGEVNKKVV
jgi:hypothetical protein